MLESWWKNFSFGTFLVDRKMQEKFQFFKATSWPNIEAKNFSFEPPSLDENGAENFWF